MRPPLTFFCLCLAALFYLLSATAVFAALFSVTFDQSDKVSENGVTTVTQNFHLTNLTSDYFPVEYLAKTAALDIKNLRAFDGSGPLDIAATKTGSGWDIRIKFKEQSVGIGKILAWTLAFETSDVARKAGGLWEIFIPKPKEMEGLTDWTVGLYVPPNFGPPTYLKPSPDTPGQIWTKNALTPTGIFALYAPGLGENPFQSYNFDLRYHLYNSRLYPVATEIALPPDTNYQKVFLRSLSPAPANVRVDQDGNWLAQYYLGPIAKFDVTATGSVAVFWQPKFKSPPENLESYLSPQKYWESQDPQIVSLVRSSTSPKEIYNFVTKTLRYDYQRASIGSDRFGAKAILASPASAICLEFTDLFIALARSANIPAREVDGTALSVSKPDQPLSLQKDVLHAWPEYFDKDKSAWIMVDPTWAKTTNGLDYFNSFDTDHIAFVIKGQNSSLPAPAGTYKTGSTNSKDVQITISDTPLDISQIPNLALRASVPTKITAGFGSQLRIFVENSGPTVSSEAQIQVSAGKLEIADPARKIPPLAPFGHAQIDINLPATPWRQESDDIITIKFGEIAKTYPIKIVPVYKNKILLLVGGLTFLGIISIIAQISWGLFIQKRVR